MSLYDRLVPAEALRWGRLTKVWPDTWSDAVLEFTLALGSVAKVLLPVDVLRPEPHAPLFVAPMEEAPMTNDLIHQLRRNASLDSGTGCNFCGPAADEIERLRDEYDDLRNSFGILTGFVDHEALSPDDRSFVERLTARYRKDRP